LKYQNIRRRYNENGQRKDVLPLNQSDLLCPTLQQFNSSGLANRFVESDMSMSIKPATSQSHRRNRYLNSPA
jgi:peptidyl-tRNA hydrolase